MSDTLRAALTRMAHESTGSCLHEALGDGEWKKCERDAAVFLSTRQGRAIAEVVEAAQLFVKFRADEVRMHDQYWFDLTAALDRLEEVAR